MKSIYSLALLALCCIIMAGCGDAKKEDDKADAKKGTDTTAVSMDCEKCEGECSCGASDAKCAECGDGECSCGAADAKCEKCGDGECSCEKGDHDKEHGEHKDGDGHDHDDHDKD